MTLILGGHVTLSVKWPMDSPVAIFIGAPLWPSAYLQSFSRYSAPNCLTSANRHCACAISRDLHPLCKIRVHILISHPHIAYSLWHFYWAPMKIKGCLLLRPPMLNAKSSENFVPTKIGQILAVLGVRRFKKLRFVLQKARPCVNPRRLSHFASKSFEGCDLQVGCGKKTESHRDSHRKDMSPLTQGLNYRSACDG